MNARLRNEGGWTLLETMTVVFIIAVLAGLVTQSLPFIQGKVRDKRREAELSTLRRVIEIYRQDTGAYPVGATVTILTNNDALTSWPGYPSTSVSVTDYVPNIVPTYYSKLPVDPMPGASTIPACQALGYDKTIAYSSNGEHYKLVWNCASETNDYSPTSYFFDPIRPTSAWALSDDMDYTTFTLGW